MMIWNFHLTQKNMVKKSLTLTLAVLVLNVFFGTIAFAQTQDNKDAQHERDVQIFVNRFGTDNRFPVVVNLKNDKKSVRGYISEIKDDTFVVTNRKKNTSTTIEYRNVKRIVKDTSHDLLIAIAVITGVLLTAALI